MFSRSYKPDYSTAHPDRHLKQYSKVRGLLHPDVYLKDYGQFYLRKCDFPYDMLGDKKIQLKEHRLLLKSKNNRHLPLDEYIERLSRAGYIVTFNPHESKSVPLLRHGHVILY